MGSDGRDCPLLKMPPEKQERLVSKLSEWDELRDVTTPRERFQLILVLTGARPGCLLDISRGQSTRPDAEVSVLMPCESWNNPVQQFLDEFDIPYVFDTGVLEVAPDTFQVSLGFYISFDAERRERLREVLSDRDPFDDVSRRMWVAYGRFFGYPESAIQAWCDDPTEPSLISTLDTEDISAKLGAVGDAFEEVGVPLTPGFVDWMLPYKVPVSATDSLDEAFADAQRFIRDGIWFADKYGVMTFIEVVDQYIQTLQTAENEEKERV